LEGSNQDEEEDDGGVRAGVNAQGEREGLTRGASLITDLEGPPQQDPHERPINTGFRRSA